jgi:hypothetical protein
MTDNTDDTILGRRYNWEFFISHVRDDTPLASRLKAGLEPPAAVFLDAEHISASDQWRAVLREALRSSLIYVFLIPLNWETYTWQDEEMTIADHLYRKNQRTRRIVPIYVGRSTVPPADEVPFGLARFPGMALPDPSDLSAARQELQNTLRAIKPIEAKRVAREDVARQDAVRVTSNGWRGLFSSDAIGFVKPILLAVIALIAVTTLAIISCAILSIWVVAARGAILILGVLLAVLIALALLVLSSVLATVVQVNRRGIKGA